MVAASATVPAPREAMRATTKGASRTRSRGTERVPASERAPRQMMIAIGAVMAMSIDDKIIAVKSTAVVGAVVAVIRA